MKPWIRIFRGLPGSGKTTAAQGYGDALVVSADDYFMQSGEYRFDATKLREARKACLKNFITAIENAEECGYRWIIVDNTNTTPVEIAPYYAVAEALGMLNIAIFEYRITVEQAFQRNTHNVPRHSIERMAQNMDMPLPPWWRIERA